MKKIFSVCVLLLTGFISIVAADFQINNEKEFQKILPPGARVEKIQGGFKFLEGPTWVPRDGGYLIFSDIPANELKKWSEKNGVETFRKPSNNANGNTLDGKGRLVTCEHSG